MKKLLNLFIVCAILTACQKEMMMNPATNGKSGSITRFAVHNGYMYMLDQNKVLTYSLANSDKPVMVSSLTTDYGLETIIVYDNYVYLGSRTSLYILDITSPANPSVLSKTDRSELVMGGCDPVVIKDNYAYSTIKVVENRCGNVSERSELEVFDVSNKSNPVLKNTYSLNEPNGLGYSGDYLFICDEGSDELIILDISNPENPVYYNSILITDPVDLIINGSKMIVSTKSDFSIYSISDMANITLSGKITKQ